MLTFAGRVMKAAKSSSVSMKNGRRWADSNQLPRSLAGYRWSGSGLGWAGQGTGQEGWAYMFPIFGPIFDLYFEIYVLKVRALNLVSS